MRILLLTPFVPHAGAAHGGAVYLASLAAALLRRAEVGLLALDPGHRADGTEGAAPAWSWRHTVPGSTRPSTPADKLRLLWRWRRDPLVAAKTWTPAMPPAIRHALATWRPEAVLVEMAQMAQYLPWLRGVPTVLTDHEAGTPANTRTGLGALGDRRDRRLWRRFVARWYAEATLVQAVTPEDAATLAGLLGREVLVRGPAIDVPARAVAPDRAPPRALFVGDYAHGPNAAAARLLATVVLPRLRAAMPAAELWLAGPNQERLRDLVAPGLRLLGFVPDLAGLFADVRLLLAPVHSGAGFRVKNLVALAHGLPVVTNELGARGAAVPPAARQVVRDDDALVPATLHWLRDPAAAAAAGRAAFEWARAELSPDAVAATQLERLQALVRRHPPPG